MDWNTFNARLSAAQKLRSEIEERLDDCYRLALPGRASFYSRDPDDQDEIYDETAIIALQEFASRIHEGMTPNFTNWMRLEAGPGVDKADRDAVNRDLEEIADYCFERIDESNFGAEAFEAYLDMGISVGSMTVGLDDQDNLRHRAIPLTNTWLERGPYGDIGGAFFGSKMRADHVRSMFPKASFSSNFDSIERDEADRELTVIAYYRRDYLFREDVAYDYAVAVIDTKEVIYTDRWEGMGACNAIHCRFSKASGEVWGRGPIQQLLPAIKTVNTTVELILQNAAMSLIGMFQIDDDGVVNPDTIKLEPGTLIPRMPGTRGLEQIRLDNSSFQVGDLVLNDQRMNIKRGTFGDMFRDPNRTPATAYEVAERRSDLAGRLSSSFGRLHHEWATPYIRRVIWLYEQAGDITLPRLRGRDLKFRAVSPMAALDRARDVNALAQYDQLTKGMFGQLAAMQYDPFTVLPNVRRSMGVREDNFLSEDDLKKAIDNLQQAAQGQPANEQTPNAEGEAGV